MRTIKVLLLLAANLLLVSPREVLAQKSSIDLLEYAKKLKELHDDLDRANRVLDYAAGAIKDIKEKKNPRNPKAMVFKNADERFRKMYRQVQSLKVPPALDPSAPEYRTDSLKKNDAAAWRMAARKLIRYNRDLRAQIAEMKKCEKRLDDVVERSKVVHKATSRLSDQIGKLAFEPVVRTLFMDVFGYAWIDLELAILPAIGDIRSTAEDKAREFRKNREERQRRLENHTSWLKVGFRIAGVRPPSDIDD